MGVHLSFAVDDLRTRGVASGVWFERGRASPSTRRRTATAGRPGGTILQAWSLHRPLLRVGAPRFWESAAWLTSAALGFEGAARDSSHGSSPHDYQQRSYAAPRGTPFTMLDVRFFSMFQRRETCASRKPVRRSFAVDGSRFGGGAGIPGSRLAGPPRESFAARPGQGVPGRAVLRVGSLNRFLVRPGVPRACNSGA